MAFMQKMANLNLRAKVKKSIANEGDILNKIEEKDEKI